MNKQYIAIIGVLVTLAGGLGVVVVNCFNSQQEYLDAMNKAYLDQSKRHSEEISKLHSEYNAKIIDLIIKGG